MTSSRTPNSNGNIYPLIRAVHDARLVWALEGGSHDMSAAEAAFWLACDELDAGSGFVATDEDAKPEPCICGHAERAHRVVFPNYRSAHPRSYLWCDDCYYGNVITPEHTFEARRITPLESRGEGSNHA